MRAMPAVTVVPQKLPITPLPSFVCPSGVGGCHGARMVPGPPPFFANDGHVVSKHKDFNELRVPSLVSLPATI